MQLTERYRDEQEGDDARMRTLSALLEPVIEYLKESDPACLAFFRSYAEEKAGERGEDV